MSRQFLAVVLALVIAYAAFMTWLNAQNARLCPGPAVVQLAALEHDE